MGDSTAAGWYPDPSGRFAYRFWNGSAWSAAHGQVSALRPELAMTYVLGILSTMRTSVGEQTDLRVAGEVRFRHRPDLWFLLLGVVPMFVMYFVENRKSRTLFDFEIQVGAHPRGSSVWVTGPASHVLYGALAAMPA